MGDSVIKELTIQPDGMLLGVTVSVLSDGRIRIETDEAQWTLPLSDSRAIATAALQAMGPVDQPGGMANSRRRRRLDSRREKCNA